LKNALKLLKPEEQEIMQEYRAKNIELTVKKALEAAQTNRIVAIPRRGRLENVK